MGQSSRATLRRLARKVGVRAPGPAGPSGARVADFRAGFEPFQGVARTFPGAGFGRTGRAGRRRHGYVNFAACQDGRPCMRHLRRSRRTRGVQRSRRARHTARANTPRYLNAMKQIVTQIHEPSRQPADSRPTLETTMRDNVCTLFVLLRLRRRHPQAVADERPCGRAPDRVRRDQRPPLQGLGFDRSDKVARSCR